MPTYHQADRTMILKCFVNILIVLLQAAICGSIVASDTYTLNLCYIKAYLIIIKVARPVETQAVTQNHKKVE
jgi:hypothetical protein